MNKNAMKTPVITELYNQSLIHTAHVKKLSDIKQNHKPQHTINKNRTNLIDTIRRNKAHTFALNFTNEHGEIASKNKIIIEKINKVKPSNICQQKNNKSYDEYKMNLSNRSRISLRQVQKQKKVQKENNRLFIKLRSASSSLKPQKFMVQHQKTERIKQRIMRYSYDASDPSKTQLKSERYLTLRGSYMTNFSSKTSTLRSPKQNYNKSMEIKSAKNNAAQHYNRSDIRHNTIQKIHQRYNTLLAKMSQPKNPQNEQETFLTLQNNHTAPNSNEEEHRLTFGRNTSNKMSNVRQNLKGKRVLIDENNNKGKSLLNPIQKLELIRKAEKGSKVKNF